MRSGIFAVTGTGEDVGISAAELIRTLSSAMASGDIGPHSYIDVALPLYQESGHVSSINLGGPQGKQRIILS